MKPSHRPGRRSGSTTGALLTIRQLIDAGITRDARNNQLAYDLPATPPDPFTGRPPDADLQALVLGHDQLIHRGEVALRLGLDRFGFTQPDWTDTTEQQGD